MSTISTAAREAAKVVIESIDIDSAMLTTASLEELIAKRIQDAIDKEGYETASLRQQLDEAKERDGNTISHLQMQLTQAKASAEKAEIERDAWKHNEDIARSNGRLIAEELAGVKSERDAALARLAILERDGKSLVASVSEITLSRDAARARLAVVEAERDKAVHAINSMGCENVVEERDSLRAQVAKLEAAFAQVEKNRNDYKAAIESLDGSNQELHDKNAKLEADAAALRDALQQAYIEKGHSSLCAFAQWAEYGGGKEKACTCWNEKAKAALAAEAGESILARLQDLESMKRHMELCRSESECPVDEVLLVHIRNLLARLADAEKDKARLDLIEEKAKRYRDHGNGLIASSAPAVSTGWNYYFNGNRAKTLREAVDSAMSPQPEEGR